MLLPVIDIGLTASFFAGNASLRLGATRVSACESEQGALDHQKKDCPPREIRGGEVVSSRDDQQIADAEKPAS